VKIKATKNVHEVKILVEDSGVGIPEWAKHKIFEQFFSLNRPDTGRRSSGLGLPLVKEIVQLHHGRIEIENRAEGGTQAILSLPSVKIV